MLGHPGSDDADASADAGAKRDSGTDAGSPHCTASSCDPHAGCDDSSGKPVCSCKPGYDGDGTTACDDIDECKSNNGGCGDNATCVNLQGTFRCDCNPGFAADGNKQCTDLCAMALADSTKCGSNARCTIQKQGASCDSCLPGFTGDGHSCSDHHADCPAECNGGTTSDTNAICVAQGSSFSCKCAAGYSGSPGSCANIDECGAGSDSCDHATAKCSDTEGGFFCTCKAGYTGDGLRCADVDECKDATLYTCPKNAGCINDPGSYHCGCVAPFTGDDVASCYCDLSGYWAMRQDLTTCWAMRAVASGGQTYISAGVAQVTVWELHKYTYDGSTVQIEKEGCGSAPDPDLYSPFFGETYSSFVPDDVALAVGFEKGADIPAPGVVPGTMFSTPDQTELVGIDLGPDKEGAAWPADSTAANVKDPGGSLPAWTDTDSDGEPGLTLWPAPPSKAPQPRASGTCTGPCPAKYSYLPVHLTTDMSTGNAVPDQRAGCVSAASRVITKLNADVDTCDRMTGDVVNVKAEGRVRSCMVVPKAKWGADVTCNASDWAAAKTASNMCDADMIKQLDTQDQSQMSKATFELVKIGGLSDTADCAAVKAALPAIVRSGPLASCPF